MKIAIIGAGSWGTAIGIVMAKSGHETILWARETEISAGINKNKINPNYLVNVKLPDSLKCSNNFELVLNGADVVIFATPSHTLREIATQVSSFLKGNETIINLAKGIENDTYYTMSQVLTEVLEKKIDPEKIAVLYGPSHAEEVAKDLPTTVVVASNSMKTANFVQSLFRTPMFRVYINRDIKGVEIAGSIKNIMAIAAGLADGCEFGDNANAALITRGLQEIRRLGMRLGASQDTFQGLAGVGDLVVTCTSEHSRNRFVGYHIGKGEKLEDIIGKMNMVAEGVKTTKSVYNWAKKLQIEMPITESVYQVLFEGLSPKDGVYKLMTREQKEEITFY